MLDSETKRHIDGARDVLVGKVPDPKAQVEQITTALIYKFMDDMDRDAQNLGGKPSFFVNGYEKYAWTRLLDPRMGGQERLNLYAEGLATMSQNPHLPQLFRDIFKDAFLPYRDPATLNLFLKEISVFNYDHSENLGDAFEYLLSVLSSQGDAGQFRTPRHIIDFMVNVVDPKKNEAMLDPACGTAGFVISTYRHIVEANGDHPLTPDEKKTLAGNLVGYDISPDMVRLSLVNMYLHSFPNPHIYEYDTLTSEDRWDDKFDILMANPPFMSPKGGIRPHKRFQIQANRSEVLFVDYIAEHLKPHGRAAVIVPEGIIFQSANAYKLLRKSLVESWGLWAVVSLPAGVFQPYSGVKTSILFLDKVFAKSTDDILFAKVQNDGFDLGAQRRAVGGSDLPKLQKVLRAWLRGEKLVSGSVGSVSKQRLADAGEYNLTGDRYREGLVTSSTWPFVRLEEVFQKSDESVLPESLSGRVTYIGLENIMQNSGGILGDTLTNNPAEIKSLKHVFQPGDILYGKLRPNLNKVWLADRTGICSTDIFVIRRRGERVLPALYTYIFRSHHFNDAVLGQLRGAQLPRVSWQSFAALEIPLPPLDVQQRIVDELDGYQRIIDGARQVIANWRPTFDIDPSWPTVKLEDVCKLIQRGRTPRYGNSSTQVIKSGQARGYFDFDFAERYYVEEGFPLDKRQLHEGDLLVNSTGVGTAGRITYFDLEGTYVADGHITILRMKDDITDSKYVLFALDGTYGFEGLEAMAQGNGGQIELGLSKIKSLEIPLPSPHAQSEVVAGIDHEQQAVESCKTLVSTYEAKIAATVARLWDASSTGDVG